MRIPLASLARERRIHHDRKSAISKRPSEHLPLPVFQFPIEEIGSRYEGEHANTGRFTILSIPVECTRRGEGGRGPPNPCHRKTQLEIEFSGHRMTI